MAHRAILLATILVAATLAQGQFHGLSSGRDRPDPNSNQFPGMPDSQKFSSTISGSVLTPDNRPVPDARVEVRTLDQSRLVGSVYSNKAGAFEIADIPNGEYEVTVTAGLRETHQQIELRSSQLSLTMRLAKEDASNAGGRTSVSVAQMQVPEKARKEYNKAEEAFGRGKLEEAQEHSAKALALYPDYAEALTLAGVLDLQQGKQNQAVASLEKAVECDSGYGMAHIALGAAYNALHRPDDALRVLGRGIALAPDSWQGYFERARALEAKQDFAASLRDVDKASQFINKDFPVLHLIKANDLIGLKAYPEAQRELQVYLAAESSGPNADEARRVLEQVKTYTAQN